jgi:hypothetical protein
MLKIKFKEIEVAYGLMKDINFLYIRVRKLYNSPIEKNYSDYTVFPGIAYPPPPPTSLI